ncbi:MAG TPA: mandelate racemase/muconate lactonizing enzyme family protein [Blastocatellia bacterium]|nr:mandelate racemase/muconate lactonizing enzyme family protein [Blastocatellia bacterium]
MNKKRRDFLIASAAVPALGLAPKSVPAFDQKAGELAAKLDRVWAAPILKTELFKQPVKIASIELLNNRRHYVVRVRSSDGEEGVAGAHDSVMATTYPIFLRRVAPFFIGKDARELESLIQGVYLADSNYKWQGLPFWVCVASLELAILDLLGRIAGKPLGELLGGVVRKEVAVYRASGNRGNSPEAEIDYLKKIVAETQAGAIKFRLGARMQYDDASTRRDLRLIPMTRQVFGDRMAIYADANGSYDIPMATRIGRIMEEQQFRFFEEPVPFDYYDETRQIAGTLKIPIALGEQESSLRSFRRIIENNVARIVQPDLLYFGGMTRSIKVARMAAAAGIDCTPHMSGGGLGYLYIAHFASCVPNCGPHQEYKGDGDLIPVSSKTSSLKSEGGLMKIPSGPGLGIDFDPEFLKQATRLD